MSLNNGKKKNNFEHLDLARPVPLAVVREGRLTFGARGLYIYLKNLPVGMTPSMESCNSSEGKARLSSLLKELKKIGAIRYEPIRDSDGTLQGTRMIIAEPVEWARDISMEKNDGL